MTLPHTWSGCVLMALSLPVTFPGAGLGRARLAAFPRWCGPAHSPPDTRPPGRRCLHSVSRTEATGPPLPGEAAVPHGAGERARRREDEAAGPVRWLHAGQTRGHRAEVCVRPGGSAKLDHGPAARAPPPSWRGFPAAKASRREDGLRTLSDVQLKGHVHESGRAGHGHAPHSLLSGGLAHGRGGGGAAEGVACRATTARPAPPDKSCRIRYQA